MGGRRVVGHVRRVVVHVIVVVFHVHHHAAMRGVAVLVVRPPTTTPSPTFSRCGALGLGVEHANAWKRRMV